MIPRAAIAATAVLGVAGLVAGPADAANNYVSQPVVTGANAITPESAVLSGAIDTGGDEGVTFTGSASNPYSFGGLTITGAGILNGIPTGDANGVQYYSTALFEADPLSDYVASGNQPGGDTVTAPVVEVDTTTGLSPVSSEIGEYPASTGLGSPLTPGTKYVYWVVQQAGETQNATTVNEYSDADLTAWINGTGTSNAEGFGSTTKQSSTSGEAAWAAGTGSYAGDPKDPTKVLASTINPDYACVVNSTIAANTNSGWAAELAAGKDPVAAGSNSINGTPLPYGISSASATGSFTPTTGQEPAEQGPCVAFYGGNSTNFYTSAVGTFTTPKLGTITIGSKGTVVGKKATISIKDASVEAGKGTIVLTAKIKGKKVKVASGKFSVLAGATGSETYKLSSKAVTALKKAGKLVTSVTATSTTDQPVKGKKITLKG